MKAYSITLKHNSLSVNSTKKLIESSKNVKNDFDIEIFNAIEPEQAYELMHEHGIRWNYPWSGQQLDLQSGLLKTAYPTKNPQKRVACFLSHYLLWKDCASSNESYFIFEHDALFTTRVDVDILNKSPYEIIGINSPSGATRRATVFNSEVMKASGRVVSTPKIDEENVPQGLAGNSAYYVKPDGAKRLLQLVDEFGAWPNDAIMCRQLIPNKLGVLKPYCTTVQNTPSTTSQ